MGFSETGMLEKAASGEETSSSPDNLEGVDVFLVVDAHDKHGGISAGGRDDDPLSATLQVKLNK